LAGTGRWAFAVAAAVYAFGRAGAGGVGVVTAAGLLPAVLAAPLAGILIDRLGRAVVVAAACAVEAVCIGAASALMGVDGALGPIILLAAMSGVAATAPRPALEALMPGRRQPGVRSTALAFCLAVARAAPQSRSPVPARSRAGPRCCSQSLRSWRSDFRG
jgi:MFS family permease